MSDINQATLDTSAKALPHLTLEHTKGASEATIKPAADLYKLLLDEDVSMEMVEKVRQNDARIAAGLAHATKEISLPAMKKDKALEKVTLEVAATGKDTFGVAYNRSRRVPDRSSGEANGTKMAYGVMSVDFNMYGTKNRAQLAAVRQAASAEAMEALSNL
jgi:hypothetical protein